jgi:hypothetical protein
MACDLNTVLAQACTNKFLQLANTDPKAARAVILQLLCNISAGGATPPFSTRIELPPLTFQFGSNYTNSTGRVMLFISKVVVGAALGQTPANIALKVNSILVDQAVLSNSNAGVITITNELTTILQPGDIVSLVNVANPALANSVLDSFAWY